MNKNLEEINTQVNRVREMMAEIAAASEQQSQGIEQVNTAADQMSQVTQQAAANAEQSAAASEELTGQAEEMKSMVANFKLSSAPASRGSRLPAQVAKRALAPLPKKPEKVVRIVRTPREAVEHGIRQDPEEVIPFDDGNQETLSGF